jgi:hypothetical protein
MTHKEIKKHFTRDDRGESIYQYIPFEVPAAASGITIEMRHDSFSSVIDLGLFDSFGFRGASGSERNVVMISQERSTPGYLPGDIPAGTWFVFIGLHRVARDGVNVEVKITFGKPNFPIDTSRPAKPIRPPRRSLKSSKGFRWFPADFHTHTVHSDGALTIDEISVLAASRGLEILAITDHNTTSHHSHLESAAKFSGLNLIAGQEVTTDSGHANSFGKHEWIDFRSATQEWLRETIEKGGLLSINHPLSAPCHWQRDTPEGIHLTELWHSSWDRKSEDPIAWWEANGRAVPIGGSDFHRLDSDGLPGEPTTWVQIDTEDNEVTQSQVLEALRSGRVAISAGTTAPVVFPFEDQMIVDGGEGCTLISPTGRKSLVTKSFESFSGEQGLYQLIDADASYQALGYRNN